MAAAPPPGRRRGAVEIRDLAFEYGSGEDGFDLAIGQLALGAGERSVLIGPSGCGKTTLLHLVAGILEPRHGRVLVDGTDVAALSDAARRRFRIANIGIIFQEFELLEHLSVRENILLPYYIHHALSLDAEVEKRLADLVASLGIEGKLARKPEHLSQGERQRVAICRALVTEPALLLADEPTGNLDPAGTRNMLELVFREVRRRGTSFVMVTHDHTILDAFDRTVDFLAFRREAVR